MDKEEQQKGLLHGYVEVKFTPVQSSHTLVNEAEGFYKLFRSTGSRLRDYGMTSANGGTLSVRHGEGFIVTAETHLRLLEQAR